MADFDMLASVKTALGLSGNAYHDETLGGYIAEVQRYLVDGGVPDDVARSEAAAGVVARGVSDLWNYGSGGAQLSPYFLMAASQLAMRKGGGNA